MKRSMLVLGTAWFCSTAAVQGSPLVTSAAGPSAASIQSQVDAFRAALGTLNPNNPGSLGSGRREINWDGVPDALSSPNPFPGNFFNATAPNRARGVEFTTPGTGFQVSANAASGTPIEFGNIDASYPALFTTFSSPRLFTAVGSNVVDVNFFIPGSATAALTSGFGAVFTDVDLSNTTSIEYFDAFNSSLGLFYVPAASGDETLSFLGVRFNEGSVVARARIISGNIALAPGVTSASGDVVAMDDFIYGEPVLGAAQALAEPSMIWLLLSGVAALAGGARMQRGRRSRPARMRAG